MTKKSNQDTQGNSAPNVDDTAAERSAVDDIMADDLTAGLADDAEPTEEVDPLEVARAELQQAIDRELRGRAELENYRKRAAREMQEQRRYADLPLMRDLLPVMDNLCRAIEAAEKTHDTASLLEGVKMVVQQCAGVLEKHHCTRIAALHEPFDPHLHEAVSQQLSDEHPANTVLIETQTGFQLHDRVVRPSQVVVSALPPKDECPEDKCPEDE
ncbi:MAG: nucleotide exchange factor GrpE [Candidatus Nealsonbacteria bacterium]|nr:nucleotide exchange factor GrpE [Candidatus Nealsonbacteria bacterium]